MHLLQIIDALVQIYRPRFIQFSLTQLPHEQMLVDILWWQMWRCRWRSTSYESSSIVFSIFLFRRQRGVDWCPWNATPSHEMSIAKRLHEIAVWACAGPTLSQELRLNRQKLRWNCGFASACWTLIARHARQPWEIMQEYACVKRYPLYIEAPRVNPFFCKSTILCV